MKQFLLGIIVALSIVLIAFFAYTIGKTQRTPALPPIDSAVAPLATPTPLPQPTPVGAIDPTVAAAIEVALTNQSYSDLLLYMAPKVTFTKYATECCGLLTPVKAVTELSYLKSAPQSWEIISNSPLADNLKQINPKIFEPALIARSEDFLVSFHLDQSSLIDNIFITASLNLYLTSNPTP